MRTFVVLAALAGICLGAQPSTPVILISVDTLRADHLGCYNQGRHATPHIDGLARGGTLFSAVSSPCPLTLPAHAVLFTSQYGFSTGVLDNGIPLPSIPTLATVLHQAGYRTAAFVGSFVLDRRFGLSQGFDVYDGPRDVHNKAEAVERKRPGAQVVEAARSWLAGNAGAPVFLFLHLYDLHLPYDLPRDPALRRGETGYTAELGYVDGLIGEFRADLERLGLWKKALVVFTSDHGEGLGDHGESTHGFFVYESTLHVPLIMHWPEGRGGAVEARVDAPAGLADVAPTILQTVAVAAPRGMRGRSLLGGAQDAEVYAESVYARNHFGCAPLAALRSGRYKYIAAPRPELYDVGSDPRELHNLYGEQRERAAAMNRRIGALRASAPQKTVAPPSADTRALRSLGYLAGKSSHAGSGVDPKDRIQDFEQYFRAVSLTGEGKLAEADALLTKLRDKLPDIADVRVSLGLNEQRQGRWEGAEREFARAVELDPGDAQAHFESGFCNFHLGRLPQATKEFEAALAIEPWYTRADEALAELYLRQNDAARARAHLEHLLRVDPDSYAAHFNLGVFAAMEQNWKQAEQHLRAAVSADPGSGAAHDALGTVYLQEGDMERARQEFQEAIRHKYAPAQAHMEMMQHQGKAAQ